MVSTFYTFNYRKNTFPNRKTEGKTKNSWTSADKEKLNTPINIIEGGLSLNFPRYDQELDLFADASDIGIKAVLKQNGKLIGVYVKKLGKSEKNYSIMEKELYALLKGLEHFKLIIFATSVNIYTDNKNILKQDSTCQRVQRCQTLLSEYNYTMHHISGRQNGEADLISRIYLINSTPNIVQEPDLHELKSDFENMLKEQPKEMHNRIRIIFLRELHSLMGHPGKRAFYILIKTIFEHKTTQTKNRNHI
ncbi:Transposon Ty3-I Gag-Pol polyprotein [Dictyocoela muelleri]|nr:Transposon Ty3-I Gag-Pol polyprotein [Dictyocoela muelleri]